MHNNLLSEADTNMLIILCQMFYFFSVIFNIWICRGYKSYLFIQFQVIVI